MTAVFLVLFLALLVIGVPIYLALGTTGALMFGVDGSLLSFAQKLIDELNSQTLLAVPYFVIAATLMERGGVAKALIGAAEAWVGHVRGGLGLVCVVSCTIFAAMCGSSVATAIAMGTILVPAMREHGYEAHFAAGIIGASGTLGILIPPSLAFVVFGVLADESIPRLFLAGVIPGLMQAALFSVYIVWYSHRHHYARGETLRSAERMSFAEIERAIDDFARRAKENKLKVEELQGGTFTITNGGIYGSLLSTPIVNPPQSGILGMHAIQDRPVARDGQVVIRPMMYVALTYDHRLVDGREAVTFLRRIKECVEQPVRLLLEV